VTLTLIDEWPDDAVFAESDPALPGERWWTCLIPRLHRALASHSEVVHFPRFRPGFDHNEACAYWETALYLLTRLVGWEQSHLGEALRWWYRAGRPTMNDPRLELLKAVWDDQRQLGLLSLWASGRTFWTNDNYSTSAGDDFGPLRFAEPDVQHSPCVGGSNPLHLGHSLMTSDDHEAVLMSPRPAGRHAAIIVNSMAGWHGALIRLGATLPSLGAHHWNVDVFARPLGWLGTFRRSHVTGLWFQGTHSVHTAWKSAT
jgi:hypothetical protein